MAGKLVVVTGIKELDRSLKRLEPRIQKKVLRQAMRAGAKILAIEVKSEAPVLTGTLRSAVKVRALRSRKRGTIGVEVRIAATDKTKKTSATTGKTAFYPAIVEYGHSKAYKNPFMYRAYRARGEQVRRVVVRDVEAGIEREATKK